MKSNILLIALIAALSSSVAIATEAGTAHPTETVAAKIHKAQGTLVKLNQDGTLNIAHGPVKTLGWPAMTMDFRVKDKSLLKGLKAGQKIDFDLASQGDDYVITGIRPVK